MIQMTSPFSAHMWPEKHNLGSQLTYGVNGTPVFSSEPGFSEKNALFKLLFPRLKNEGPRFHQIQNSTTEISPGSALNGTKLGHSYGALLAHFHDEFSVPVPLLDIINMESKPLHEVKAHDLSKDALATNFTLGTGGFSEAIMIQEHPYYPRAKSSMVAVTCHAFTSASNVLKIVPMMPKSKNFFHTQDAKNSKKCLFNLFSLAQYPVECRFPFEIHQMEICGDNKVLAVRGLMQVVFLVVSWRNEPGKKGIMLEKAFTVPIKNAQLAHMVLCRDRFILVDSKGEYTAYTYNRQEEWVFRAVFSGIMPPNEAKDLSPWRRLCWTPSMRFLIYFTRKNVFRMSLKHNSLHKLITFHAWSTLRDFAIFDENLFLLTSQEIIWTQISMGGTLKRLLSWKHYLDNQDVTLRLSAAFCEAEDAYICMAYSGQAPLKIMYTFGHKNGLPCSLRDPYMVPTQIKVPMRISLYASPPISDTVGSVLQIIETGPDYRLMSTSYCRLEHRAFTFRNLAENGRKPSICRPTPSEFNVSTLKALYQHFMQELVDSDTLHLKRKFYTKKKLQSLQCGFVQDYALKLGPGVETFFDHENGAPQLPIRRFAFRLLASLGGKIPLEITDLEEFESMISQLRQSYASKHVTLLPFESKLLKLFNNFFSLQNDSVTEIPKALEIYDERGRARAVMMLAPALMRTHDAFLPRYADCIRKEGAADFPAALAATQEAWKISVPADCLQENADTYAMDGTLRKPTKQSHSLLRRALTQNSQVYADSQILSQVLFRGMDDSGSEDNYVSASEEMADFQDHHVSCPPAGPAIVGTPPNIVTVDESESESRSKSQSKVISASQLKKRPATIPVENMKKKKKKAKGGFA